MYALMENTYVIDFNVSTMQTNVRDVFIYSEFNLVTHRVLCPMQMTTQRKTVVPLHLPAHVHNKLLFQVCVTTLHL